MPSKLRQQDNSYDQTVYTVRYHPKKPTYIDLKVTYPQRNETRFPSNLVQDDILRILDDPVHGDPGFRARMDDEMSFELPLQEIRDHQLLFASPLQIAQAIVHVYKNMSIDEHVEDAQGYRTYVIRNSVRQLVRRLDFDEAFGRTARRSRRRRRSAGKN